MPDDETQCQLSNSTARLSISVADASETRKQLSALAEGRRGSAISLGSASSEESNGNKPVQSVTKGKRIRKRRTSSVVSKDKSSIKIHKRKLNKINEQPRLEIVTKDKEIAFSEFSKVYCKVFAGSQAPSKSVQVYGHDKIDKVVTCLVGGLGREDFVSEVEPSEKNQQPIPFKDDVVQNYSFFADVFDGALATRSPGDKVTLFPLIESLTWRHLTNGEKKQALAESEARKITIHDLLLSLPAMRANGYPIHSEQEPGELADGWAETKCPEDNKSRIFALDCEFCKSDDGQQLTRISIITFDGEVVYDTFVMPSVPITDYVTRFSGVTKELLEGVKTTLDDVQKKFVEIVSSNDILVGHSLESDLNVLKIRHPKIVDTSLCYHHARGPPSKPGLRWLCSTYLARDIQQGEASGVGHSSIEDAKACLDLVKLKIMKGMIYGTNYHEAPWLDKINQMRKEEAQGPISQVIVDYEHHSNSPEFSTHYKVNSDEEVVDQFTRTVDQSDFFILSLRELEASKGWESPCKQNFTVEESYKNLSRRLNTIYSLLPENSLLVVSSIQGKDTSCITQLRAQRRALMQAPASNNTGDADGENESEHSIQTKQLADKLKEEVRLARKCVTFMTLKQDPFVVEN